MADPWAVAPVAFSFSVAFGGQPTGRDASFQSVGGIAAELETEAVAEGGENRFVHQLPRAAKAPRLTLERGVAPKESQLVQWCRKVLERGLVERVETQLVHLFLLDSEGQPLRAWSFANAYPVRWEVQPLSSTKNELALEKIELCYAYSKRDL